MPLVLQSRLLRVLQDKHVAPLGGGTPKPADFVVVCATNRDVAAMVNDGTFRADLFFRIAQFCVKLPRVADMPDRVALVRSLWRAHEQDHGPLPPSVLERLVAHDWPGNLRELANALNATAALAGAGNAVTLDDLPYHMQPMGPIAVAMLSDGPLGSVTEATMQRALEQHRGNFSAAARALGIDRSTLYRRLVWKK